MARQVRAGGQEARRPAGNRRRGGGRRVPLPDRIARSVNRASGRTDASRVPTYIRAHRVELVPEARDFLRRKLGAKLGKFAGDIERVSVQVAHVNGPRGGVDYVCRIKVVLSGLPSVVFQHQDAMLPAAINGAVQGIERAVRRSVERRWMHPRTQRARRVPWAPS